LNGTRGRSFALALIACGVLLAGVAAVASAASTYVFDEVLSLTGDCGTSKVDLTPDPGCPEDHPPSSFTSPRSVATDFYGNIYVASYGKEFAGGAEGRIDIFDSAGVFIAQIPVSAGPKNLAVDSNGHLYVFAHRPGQGGAKVLHYAPSVYAPGAGEIAYGNDPSVVVSGLSGFFGGLAVNPTNDHLFLHLGPRLEEYGSAAEENKLLNGTIGEGIVSGDAQGLAIDASRGFIYASDETEIAVLDLDPPHALLRTIDGSDTPAGSFSNKLTLSVNEETGDLFVYDGEATNVVYQLTEAGEYISTIAHEFQYVYGAEIRVDNGPSSPNKGYLYVPSHPSGTGHSFAFGPAPPVFPPEVESISFSEVTESEAELRGVVHPGNLETSYVIEYTPLTSFEKEGFANALVAGKGQIPAGGTGVEVSAQAAGLSQGTTYRFRVVAENECEPAGCEDAVEGQFTTYAPPELPLSCPNDLVRTGPSALLPDCRAYELVTPANTNARAPIGVGYLGVYFAAPQASPGGDRVSFMTEGGSIPGMEGTGAFAGDPYLATRGEAGWSTTAAGPTGAESSAPLPGSTSPDQGLSFWQAGGSGTAIVDGKSASYVRYPDGHSELVGRGSIATDPQAEGKLIGENGSHIVFVSSDQVGKTPVKLEPNAPPSGTQAIYDRTPDEVTHVVSLLPGDITPAAGQDASYVGASLDGEGVAFEIGTTLYLRHNNEATYEIGENVTFAGVAEGGERIFYVKGGNLFALDVDQPEPIQFTSTGDVTVVNVSADGSAAYFVSPSVLTGDANPNGATAQAGKENLYLSEEGAIDFVGIVTERDVEGEFGGNVQVGGLGLWLEAVGPGSAELPGRFGVDPSRTTPDGSALLFESRAALTGYDPEGHAQVYRYDSVAATLQCLSCNPTQAAASGEASLQSISQEQGGAEPFSAFALVHNLRADGKRAFFQSEEALVVGDTDGLQDVYEWEAEGVGSCKRPEGCVYLISSGHSGQLDYLYAVSDSGDDVFFQTADLLLSSDTDSTPSIYDARVGGGFLEGEEEECQGEGCRPGVTLPPAVPAPAPPALGAKDNVPRVKRCPKGKRKVKRNGKVKCVKKHHKKRHKPSSKKGAGK
jgi:hypothetical protein